MSQATPDHRTSLDILVDDGDLRITRRPGRTDRCVVSFSGVGLNMGGLGEVQREEFGRSAGEAGDATLIFVMDKRRSWMNAVQDRILQTLAPELQGVDRVTTLGNSMGGFAAIYFAPLLANCRRAIAFSPQFSVNPKFMPREEKRWAQFREAIAEHVIGHAFDQPSDAVDYWLFFGIGKRQDQAHIASFARPAAAGPPGLPRRWRP